LTPQRQSWTAPLSNGGSALTDYVVQRSPNGTTWTTLSDGVSTATAYTAIGLANGTRYYFRVYARTARGTSPSSNIVNAIPRTVPSAPRSPVAAPTNLSGQIRLTWVAPASTGGSALTDYIIQRSPNGTTWTTLSDGISTATGYTATGLANGTRYYFRVFAKERSRHGPGQRQRQRNPANRPEPTVVSLRRSLLRRVLRRVGHTVEHGRISNHELRDPGIRLRHGDLVHADRRRASDTRPRH
jgi:Fibronectin type III domain